MIKNDIKDIPCYINLSVVMDSVKITRLMPSIHPLLYLVIILPVTFLIIIPTAEIGAGLTIKSGANSVVTPLLERGHLYKLVIEGILDHYALSDAILKSSSGRYDCISNLIMIGGKNSRPDLSFPYCHRYVYYIPGQNNPVLVDLNTSSVRNIIGKNDSGLSISIDKADFKLWVDAQPFLQSERILFHYSLDPIPRSYDEVALQVYDEEGNRVFMVCNNDETGIDCGSSSKLTGVELNQFIWYGIANEGEYRGRVLPPGGYWVELTFRRGRNVYHAFCEGEKGDMLHIALTHRFTGSFPRVVQRSSSYGSLFPYQTHRALKVVESYPGGIEGIYTEDEGVGDDFLYYGGRGIIPSWCYTPSRTILSIQRTLNLIRSSYWEFYGSSSTYPELLEMNGVYDNKTAEMVRWFRENFDVSVDKEVEILQKYDNIPPRYDQTPTEKQLSYIIAGDTLKAMIDTEFRVRGISVPITLADLDNLPAYDPDDEYHSLYHLFEEIGARTISSGRRHKILKSGDEPYEGVVYDISENDFVAMMVAVCYQESGITHHTGSGRIFRAGRGRGSATGYMQLTADVIQYDNFVLTFPSDGGLKSVRLGDFSFKDRYALRNISRSNLEIGAQFLREMWYNIESKRFDKRFSEEIKAGGILDVTDEDGFIKRVKLAGASYNAGPEAVRVMIEYPYDDPDTDENESVSVFFDEFGGDIEPYLERFRNDLELRMRGEYMFPVEGAKKGRETIDRLIKWLGPYWHRKFAGISWDEAALMKLDREVLGYVRNIAINTKKLLSPELRERIFKEKMFNLLVVKKKQSESEEGGEKEETPMVSPLPVKPEEQVMPSPHR